LQDVLLAAAGMSAQGQNRPAPGVDVLAVALDVLVVAMDVLVEEVDTPVDRGGAVAVMVDVGLIGGGLGADVAMAPMASPRHARRPTFKACW
jgi:hypothetical protein